MRVLAVMASGATGGGANHLLLVLPALARLGVEVHAAVGADGPTAERLRGLGIPTHPLELMRSRVDPRGPLALGALVRRLRPALVHHHGTRAAFFGALARPLTAAVPTVYTAHGLAYAKPGGGPRRAAFVAAERLACAGAAHVVSVSAPDLDDLVRRGFVPRERGTHLENPIDPRHFEAADPEPGARERLGLAPDALTVVSVARLVPQKAVQDLVGALGLCRARVQLAVVGDGPDRGRLEQAARPLGEAVRWLGERGDVPDLWPAFDAFALSSHWEGEPMALLEAMAAARPCVATATAGSTSVLTGTAGHLVPVGDPSALARALEELAALPPAARRAEGHALRERVRGRGPDAVARRLLAVYEQVLERGPAPRVPAGGGVS